MLDISLVLRQLFSCNIGHCQLPAYIDIHPYRWARTQLAPLVSHVSNNIEIQ